MKDWINYWGPKCVPVLRKIGATARTLWLVVFFTVWCVYLLPVDDRSSAGDVTLGVGGEMFPFSSFPMYSRNKSKSYIVYLRDDQGNPVGTEGALGVRSSVLKKDYDAELKKIKKATGIKSDYSMTPEQKRPAAESMLKYLITERSPDRVKALGTTSLELVDLRIIRKDGKLTKDEAVVGKVVIEP